MRWNQQSKFIVKSHQCSSIFLEAFLEISHVKTYRYLRTCFDRQAINWKPTSRTSHPLYQTRLLLAGPAYENSKYKCSILIETKKLFVWAITFGKTIILQNENQLESVRYLATQVINANNDDETVKLLDESLRVVLDSYLPSFLQQNYLTVFCPHCRKNDVEVKTISSAKDEGPNWVCVCGQSLWKEKWVIWWFQ